MGAQEHPYLAGPIGLQRPTPTPHSPPVGIVPGICQKPLPVGVPDVGILRLENIHISFTHATIVWHLQK